MDFDWLEVKQVWVAFVSEQKSFLAITNQDPTFIWNSEVSHFFSSLLRQSRLSVAEFGVAEFALCQRHNNRNEERCSGWRSWGDASKAIAARRHEIGDR
jgi:hypothetical protein